MTTIGIIPARLQSSRLREKMLLSDTGKPLIQHTWEAACRAQSLDEVYIATPIHSVATLEDRSCVKVVCAADQRALYFSRLPVPFSCNGKSYGLLHLGLYAYRRSFLLAFADTPQSHLERVESLEQLRALETGASIYVEIVPYSAVGIDTTEDYIRFVERRKGLSKS